MLTLLTLLTNPANAWNTSTNPQIVVKVVRDEADLTGGYAELDGVRVHYCGGGYTDYTANATFDPVQGWSATINGGNLCMVEVIWDSSTFVWSEDFELKSSVTSHNVKITTSENATDWTPFMLADGTFWGSDPKLIVAFD